MTMFTDVEEFHKAFNLSIRKKPELPDMKERELRGKLLTEEFREYIDAEYANDLVEIADALADIIYIACGTALSYGIPLDEVFKEVHRSNMAKLGPDGNPIYREDGKVIKPVDWVAPDIRGVLFK
jgi:predicted HAD superfamily Cof-like phosphohydrolase